jgi:hypothetical protein
MHKVIFASMLLLALTGCTTTHPMSWGSSSACAAGENTYACQVERYNSVNVD